MNTPINESAFLNTRQRNINFVGKIVHCSVIKDFAEILFHKLIVTSECETLIVTFMDCLF